MIAPRRSTCTGRITGALHVIGIPCRFIPARKTWSSEPCLSRMAGVRVQRLCLAK